MNWFHKDESSDSHEFFLYNIGSKKNVIIINNNNKVIAFTEQPSGEDAEKFATEENFRHLIHVLFIYEIKVYI